MTLSDLYPPGTKLVDVPPNFEGMNVRQWHRLKMGQQFANAPKVPDGAPGTEWRNRAIRTHRDDYGLKGVYSPVGSLSPKK